jgi:hypothetical protein
MDPQLDVNALIKLLRGVPEFVAFANANQAQGLTYNRAARSEFLANGLGTEGELDTLAQGYGIVLLTDVSEAEIEAAATRLVAGFDQDAQGRLLRLPDGRILATAFLKGEGLATGDLQLFKRGRDLGRAVVFVGGGRAATRAAAYSSRPVTIPGPS